MKNEQGTKVMQRIEKRIAGDDKNGRECSQERFKNVLETAKRGLKVQWIEMMEKTGEMVQEEQERSWVFLRGAE